MLCEALPFALICFHGSTEPAQGGTRALAPVGLAPGWWSLLLLQFTVRGLSVHWGQGSSLPTFWVPSATVSQLRLCQDGVKLGCVHGMREGPLRPSPHHVAPFTVAAT